MTAIGVLVILLGALVADRADLPGGVLLGGMIGAALTNLSPGDISIHVPVLLRDAALVVLGASIGASITRDALPGLVRLLPASLLASTTIIAAGVLVALLLRRMGMAPDGDLLATSPGALSAMSAIALDRGVGAVEVAMFHLTRVVAVLVTMPILLRLLGTDD